MQRIQVIDSHTAGEPTRVVVAGGPDLGHGPMAERLERLRTEFDTFRSAVVNEPRGNDAIVGALLCEPADASCDAGVIFFNNVGYLSMCGHGTIGLVVTLAHLGRMAPGRRLPAGDRLRRGGGAAERQRQRDHSQRAQLSRRQARAGGGARHRHGGRRHRLGRQLVFPGGRPRPGARARPHRGADRFSLAHPRRRWTQHGITGADGREIDHIELFGPPTVAGADSRNFVLCPGKAYDRSPCGTGTSAKLACLYADGKLRPGQVWRQESIVGSVFEGTVSDRRRPGRSRRSPATPTSTRKAS